MTGGGFEYLHRDPASRRRRRKGKSKIWDSKIWSRVQRDSDLRKNTLARASSIYEWDSDPRKTTLSRASSIYKRQTRPLVRENAPQKQDRNCQRVINIWSQAPDGARHQDLLTNWLTISRNVTLTFDFDSSSRQRDTPVWRRGSNTSTVTLRVVGGDEKGSPKSETVKYCHENQGTRTRERLLWRGPATYTKDRPVLSSEKAPHKTRP
jgi:hypothetical protein